MIVLLLHCIAYLIHRMPVHAAAFCSSSVGAQMETFTMYTGECINTYALI